MDTVYSRRQLRYLDAMGIPAWTRRQSEQPLVSSVVADAPVVEVNSPATANAGCTLDDFASWLSGLYLVQSARSKLLEGDPASTLLVVEDATLGGPGQRPFAGPSSRMFDAMLKAIELNRRSALLGTLVPLDAEVAVSPEPLGALTDVSPRAVLFYSMPAGQHGLHDFDALRERAHVLSNGVPCVVSYHPTYLMDNNQLKRAAWNDLKRVRQLLD